MVLDDEETLRGGWHAVLLVGTNKPASDGRVWADRPVRTPGLSQRDAPTCAPTKRALVAGAQCDRYTLALSGSTMCRHTWHPLCQYCARRHHSQVFRGPHWRL
ncbi:hypothetical protein BV25DRAFT_316251 [Artomyces pyxidatus]|uniref:Uncharacterized protein n=1 Tax=Artomyces pyxidatus TaxID=48021 RepID=A0ACB8T699_9AGAM|nr:hypothetical protein BV25DRAFT_316251 [Artomyces pyxidatus]